MPVAGFSVHSCVCVCVCVCVCACVMPPGMCARAKGCVKNVGMFLCNCILLMYKRNFCYWVSDAGVSLLFVFINLESGRGSTPCVQHDETKFVSLL